ncbi:type IV secretory system conjugative DNA transfer family protein [Hydrogenophaga sp.]|uniref:type IV secretory system conjugative DNA transfer family protein n=1 Tax=Hydrogenophaga sp. TaxID=1904254 RepID=UPI0027168B0F|nr:type IV secretory system conjugative DNA transfer family protein [Hydrogenophaga sp.]MDO8906039.1 type IV secretory system conjugative DNA transfer family protein [Hydrogenophaga sp.]
MSKAKWWFLAGLLVIAMACGAYLSGLLLFWRLDMPLKQVALTSYVSYWLAHADHPIHGATVRSSGLIGIGFSLLVGMALVLALVLHRRPNLYGDARFATLADLRGKNMLKPEDTALVVGKKDGKFLYFNGQQFAMVAAPTRSGKGVGIVIPNLLSYQGSVVVLDIKQENFDLTSGFRARYGQSVYLFNPFAEDFRTHRWNPLGYVSSDPNFRISDLQSIAAMLYPTSSPHKDPFWANQAQNAFMAFALYAFEQADYLSKRFKADTSVAAPTMGSLYRLASGRADQDFKSYLKDLASWLLLSQPARTAFVTLLSQADETFASIMGTFKEPLNPWLNPVVDAATTVNDFDLREVRKRRMSIYVVIQPNKLAESRLILNLFFSQLINQNTRELPQANPELKHQCLLLMDEFTSIGRMDIIANAVSFMAGYNLRLMPIVQSLSQLESTYGREVARTLLTNHALRIIFAPREQQDANEYSEMLGYTSVRKRSVSRSRSRESSYTRSESEERRALMLPQELKALGDDKQILIVEGMAQPVMSQKIRHFKEAVFKRRVEPRVVPPLLQLGSLRASAATPSGFPTAAATGLPPERVMQMQPKTPPPPSPAAAEPPATGAVTRSGGLPSEYTGLGGIVGEFDRALTHVRACTAGQISGFSSTEVRT